MLLSPALTYGILSFLYSALILLSLHLLWPWLPEPGFLWSLIWALLPGLIVMGLFWLLRQRQAAQISSLSWVLLINALVLWIVIAFQELPVSG